MSFRQLTPDRSTLKLLSLLELRKHISDTVFWSANTVWWTNARTDLQWKDGVKFPVDVFGSPLMQSKEVGKFFDMEKVVADSSYGKYPVTTFVMCHHQNLFQLLSAFPREFPKGRGLWITSIAHFAQRITLLVDEGKIPNFEPGPRPAPEAA